MPVAFAAPHVHARMCTETDSLDAHICLAQAASAEQETVTKEMDTGIAFDG